MSGVERSRPHLEPGPAPFPQLGAQTLAALGTTTTQHGATAGGRHTRAKTVSAGPSDLTGLVGSFHDTLLDEPIDSLATPPGVHDARNGFFVETRRVLVTLKTKRCSAPANLSAPNARQILPQKRTAGRLKCEHFKRKYSKRPQDTRRATPRQEGRRRLPPISSAAKEGGTGMLRLPRNTLEYFPLERLCVSSHTAVVSRENAFFRSLSAGRPCRPPRVSLFQS